MPPSPPLRALRLPPCVARLPRPWPSPVGLGSGDQSDLRFENAQPDSERSSAVAGPLIPRRDPNRGSSLAKDEVRFRMAPSLGTPPDGRHLPTWRRFVRHPNAGEPRHDQSPCPCRRALVMGARSGRPGDSVRSPLDHELVDRRRLLALAVSNVPPRLDGFSKRGDSPSPFVVRPDEDAQGPAIEHPLSVGRRICSPPSHLVLRRHFAAAARNADRGCVLDRLNHVVYVSDDRCDSMSSKDSSSQNSSDFRASIRSSRVGLASGLADGDPSVRNPMTAAHHVPFERR